VETIALVTPASRTNLGWDQQAADGIEAAAAELGIEALVQENGGYDDITPILQDLKDDGAGPDRLPRLDWLPDQLRRLRRHRERPVVVVEDPQAVVPNLVSDLETQAQEPAYLAGVLAARRRRPARWASWSPASRRPGTS
jgi:basic membrane lipoprotein Med (substrate-binding protein (PBP1-ABC) superfamily)